MMLFLAKQFGQRIEWRGPIVFGVGYLFLGSIYFDQNERIVG